MPAEFSELLLAGAGVHDAPAGGDLSHIVVVVDVYPARERAEDFPGVDGRMIAAAAAEEGNGRTVDWLPRFDQADRFLRELLRPGDLCLVMGAGNVDDLARALVTLV